MAFRIRSRPYGIKRLNNISSVGVYRYCKSGACELPGFSNHKRDKEQGVFNAFVKIYTVQSSVIPANSGS